jgi:hypothetical protein
MSLDRLSMLRQPQGGPRRAMISRRLLVAVAWLFSAALLTQVLIAGLAVFVHAEWWARHRNLVHGFEWLSPVAVALAHLGRTSRGVKILAWATVGLLFIQYVTIGMRVRPGLQALASLHPVGAVMLFWVATELARRARREQ